MDLMHRLGVSRGVKFIGVTDSFMSPEYKLITVRGELGIKFEVQNAEVDRVLGLLKSRVAAPNNPSRFKAYVNACYDVGSYVYRYLFRYWLRYKILGDIGYEYRFAPILHKLRSLDQILATFKLNKFYYDEKINVKLVLYTIALSPTAHREAETAKAHRG